jgi:hypothetical protein
MNRPPGFIPTTIAMLALAAAMPANDVAAQEMQRIVFPTSAERTKYTQQHLIEVGDQPGHHVRVFEIHRTFTKEDAPVINGLALREQWSRGHTDYAGNSGPGAFYGVYVLENGDKFFTYSSIVAHRAGSGLSAVTVGRITGGTGKFATMQGTVRTVLTADPAVGVNEGQTEIEYILRLETNAKNESSRPPTTRSVQR